MKIIHLFFIALLFTGCGVGCDEEWICKIDGKNMYSISSSGKIGSADKGCSCDEIREFELQTFGTVDEDALKRDFGCP